MLARTVSLKRTVSCVTMADLGAQAGQRELADVAPVDGDAPAVTSQKRGSRFESVVFPPPDCPTTATTSPRRRVMLTPWSTGGLSSSYRKETSSKRMASRSGGSCSVPESGTAAVESRM